MTNEVKLLIAIHTKARLKTCDAALANNIVNPTIMKTRGECKLILKALEAEPTNHHSCQHCGSSERKWHSQNCCQTCHERIEDESS